MNTTSILRFLFSVLLISFACIAQGKQPPTPSKYSEPLLKTNYESFVRSLDSYKVAADYPKTVEDLRSDNTERQVKAVRVLGATGEANVIPWLVPLLDSEDATVRIAAGGAIEKIVSAIALKRRDTTRPDKVVLRPLADGDLDLRPMAWVALKMFHKPDDGNTHAYAASIVRYIEARELEPELRACLRSRHPAVSEKARLALESLGFAVDEERD